VSGIVLVEEGLAGGVGVGSKGYITIVWIVLAVVENDDSSFGKDGWRTYFGKGAVEVGPPPILTEAGIVVLYNGKNDPDNGDPALGANAYAAGQALFDKNDPTHLIARDESPFLKPEQPYEKTGQYVAGTTFAEGLVRFHNRWFLYYGCADSTVGVVLSR
jgi:predicted GH43/DUF377 family glycosyl hydrolase